MEVAGAFDQFQSNVNADLEQLDEARRRRDLFKSAFSGEDDVERTFPSGSLARGTILEPIHDVDFVVVFRASDHPAWGSPGTSAADSLGYVSGRVNALLGATNGTVAQEVRLASPRNHSVKCFLDDPGADDPFTVDVTPALEQDDGTLLIPEKASKEWVPTDPEDLIERIAARYARWNQFVPTVRILKHWNRRVAGAGMKSLVVEVLAYNCIPDIFRTDGDEHRPEALSRFFTAAALAVEEPICDPAGLCGEIQPDIDTDLAKRELQAAADGAYVALAAARRGDAHASICEWRKILGVKFPEPPGGCRKGSGGKPAAAAAPRLIRDTPQGG